MGDDAIFSPLIAEKLQIDHSWKLTHKCSLVGGG